LVSSFVCARRHYDGEKRENILLQKHPHEPSNKRQTSLKKKTLWFHPGYTTTTQPSRKYLTQAPSNNLAQMYTSYIYPDLPILLRLLLLNILHALLAYILQFTQIIRQSLFIQLNY
jgi:hypothetical protein